MKKKISISSFEEVLFSLILILLALFPFADIAARKIFRLPGVPFSDGYVRHLLLWLALGAGLLSAREDKHLSFSLGVSRLPEKCKIFFLFANIVFASFFCISLSLNALSYIIYITSWNKAIGIVPAPIILAIIPVAFCMLFFRFQHSSVGSKVKIARITGFLLGLLFSLVPILHILSSIAVNIPILGVITGWLDDTLWLMEEWMWNISRAIYIPLVLLTIFLGLFGMPIFLVMGGVALFLFAGGEGQTTSVPNAFYTILTGSPFLPSIPLFALIGFLLSESGAAKRLVRFFNILFGGFRGGIPLLSVLLCALFTAFTGASGVTILALGGLLVNMMRRKGFSEQFSTGLLTSSGSIGLLFPPSLPVIMYGSLAGISIKELFLGGFLPGVLLGGVLCVMGIIAGSRLPTTVNRESVQSDSGEMDKLSFKLFLSVLGELFLPVFIIVSFFFFGVTLLETSALAVIYTLILVTIVHKDLNGRELRKVLVKTLSILGGILMIIGMAGAISDYIGLYDISDHLANFMEQNVRSKWLFLFLLNVTLLITGCLMDIYSAIIIVAPLIREVASRYDIPPIQLGIIFLANLELGYLTPPVGMSLFLSSYRFEMPLTKVYRNVLPFLLLLFLTVLLITYVPWFSTILPYLFR